jgi:hypothetical protein
MVKARTSLLVLDFVTHYILTVPHFPHFLLARFYRRNKGCCSAREQKRVMAGMLIGHRLHFIRFVTAKL